MKLHRFLAPVFLVASACPSLAAGFQLQERSATGAGRAFSGEAAIADDASVIASNPAAMLLLKDRWSFAVGGSAILGHVEVAGRFTPAGATGPIPAYAGNVAKEAYVPYFYAAGKITDSLSLGFGAYTTYGLRTNYPVSFSARSDGDFSELTTINLNPSLAWRINEQWSIGAGFDAQRADGKLNSTLPNTQPLLDIGGNDWGYGYNFGVLYEPNACTRFGLAYRSSVDLTLEGRAVSVVPIFNGFTTLDVELPDSVEFSAVHEMGDWSIHGDVVWTNWSKFKQLAPIIPSAPVQPTAVQEQWDDAWRISLGTTWRATPTLTWRAGLAWDQSPVPDSRLTLRIPDSDRFWLSTGISWQFLENWKLDAGYTHIFADDVRINEGTAATGFFHGKASASADVVSLGIATQF
ncbi:MAG: hypothetical protein JWO82_1188 [Akkermansiaceae bacterium]|nr:hypothetical protein [Akkermansiaceae bacterium]